MLARSVASAVSSQLPALQAAVRSMSSGVKGVKGFSEHEQAVENMYFNKARQAD
jgi:hypothetical protein